MKEVTPEALEKVKLNFQWVADALPRFLSVDRPGRVVVVMGSKSDEEFCGEITKNLKQFAVKYELRIVSAHKAPEVSFSVLFWSVLYSSVLYYALLFCAVVLCCSELC